MAVLIILTLMAFVNGESLQCTKYSANAALRDRNTIVDTSWKTLKGTWLSEGCETRPGPEYVLRHYSFHEDGKYKLIQHHYWDDSCSSPKLTIISTGHLKTRRDSFLNHDALSGYIKPINITITPQDYKAAKELDTLVSTHCPGQYWKSWRRYEEHLVYSNISPSPFYKLRSTEDQNHHDRNTQQYLHNISGNLACLGPFRSSFNELKLIKIQLRPNSNFLSRKPTEMHWELLLGDIPSRTINIHEHYMPTGFQIPLVKISKGETVTLNGKERFVKHSCNICAKLLANERAPPHLMEKPRLPPFIQGEWVSERCEIRPLGLYLTRKFNFYDNVWVGEHRFYKDPFCAFSKFVVTAAGGFAVGEINKALREASNIDFKIERASLVIFDRNMAHSIISGTCGEDVWKIGTAQELSLTNGCFQLGIVIPSVQYDIVKVEMNYEGLWLLFLGQADTENLPRSVNETPSAFQLPLVKCGDEQGFVVVESFSNQGCQLKCWAHLVVLVIFFIILKCCPRGLR